MMDEKPPSSATCHPTDAEAWLEFSFNIMGWLRPMLMVAGAVAIPAIVLLGSRVNIELLLGLQFKDAEIEHAFIRQRAGDINREGRLYLKLTPFCALVYLYVGQYAMLLLTLCVVPFFFLDVPLWAWKAVGKYPGTIVQVVSWLYLLDANAPTFDLMSMAVILIMASYSFGRLCFITWSGYAAQVALVFACQVDFAARLGGKRGASVGAVFFIVNIWLLMHHYIMLQDRRESFSRLRQNVALGHDLSLYTKAIDARHRDSASHFS